MKCRLTKIDSKHENVRTKEVVGDSSDWPTEGLRFSMTAPSLNEKGLFRMIVTTKVLLVAGIDENSVEFTTANSHYRFEVLNG